MREPEKAVEIDLVGKLVAAALTVFRRDPSGLHKAIAACEEQHRKCRDEGGRAAVLRLWSALENEQDRVQPRLDLRARAAGDTP